MTAKEVCFLLDADGRVLWSDEGAATTLPDSLARWEAIWALRSQLAEVAHSHPRGPLGFSGVDRTTMEALERALGRALRYSVVAPTGTIRCLGAEGEGALVQPEPLWAETLRKRSGMRDSASRPGVRGA